MKKVLLLTIVGFVWLLGAFCVTVVPVMIWGPQAFVIEFIVLLSYLTGAVIDEFKRRDQVLKARRRKP